MRSHAVLDLSSRTRKALKIEMLLREYRKTDIREVLEVGTGSGHIARHFATLGATVHATDVNDQRQVHDGYMFLSVAGTELPFETGRFDLVISNHVIEHVGDMDAQLQHLREVFRCLEPGGVLYFSVPNKWFPIEPHYKLPLLSWLPPRLASLYVRWSGRGSDYDCRLLSSRECRELLQLAGFQCRDVTLSAIPHAAAIEGTTILRIMCRIPKGILRLLRPGLPTFIFLSTKPQP